MLRVALAWLLFCTAATAQVGQIPGWPPIQPVVSAGFQGPGDVVAGATVFYGLRAYSAAKRGNALVNVCNSTGGVDVGCGDLSSDATTGALVPATISGITCPGANCTVKQVYDQIGTNCSGPCVLDRTTAVSNRPTLVANCIGSLPCMVFTAASTQSIATFATWTSVPLAYQFSTVAQRVGTSAGQQILVRNPGDVCDVQFVAGSANISMYGGSTSAGAAFSINTWHAMQILCQTGASAANLNIDASGSPQTIGASGALTGLTLGDPGTQPPDMKVTEIGVWPNTAFAGHESAMSSNQHSYWGF